MRQVSLCGTVCGMAESLVLENTGTVSSSINPEITAMYQVGMHFGYAKTRRHPGMRPYIFGTKNDVEVFDLFKVLPKLDEALSAVRAMGEREGVLLFVGTKASAKEAVHNAAGVLNMPYVTERWLGGTITNFKVITERVQYWQNLKRQKEAGELKKYTKHEQTKLAQHIDKLEYMFKGLEGMKHLPQALVVVDTKEEGLSVREAQQRKVPVIALSNTDTDPAVATYVIPGNDNAKASIVYVLNRIVQAYQEGVALRASSPIVSVSTAEAVPN